jgi:VIT1/CCC1 family predicted Fe2+/Mn2+ transporter
MEPMTELKEDARTVGRRVGDLAGEIGTLVRQEVALARTEMAEKVREAKGGATKIGAGSALLHAASFALAAMGVLGLTLLLVNWMSALAAATLSTFAVGLVLGIAGYSLLRAGGREISATNFVPHRTLESIKQDVQWAKGRLSC